MPDFDSAACYELALRLIEEKRFERAAFELEKLVVRKATLPDACFSLARCFASDLELFLSESLDFDELDKSLSELLDESPELAMACLARAGCKIGLATRDSSRIARLEMQNSKDPAIVTFIKAVGDRGSTIASDPAYSSTKGLLICAVEDCDRAQALGLDEPELHVLRAFAFRLMGDKERAEEDERAVLAGGLLQKAGARPVMVTASPSMSTRRRYLLFIHAVDFIAYAVALRLVLPATLSVEFTGAWTALLFWCALLFLLAMVFRLSLIGIVSVSTYLGLPREERDLTSFAYNPVLRRRFFIVATFSWLLGAAVAFFSLSFSMGVSLLQFSSMIERLMAALVVGITVMVMVFPINFSLFRKTRTQFKPLEDSSAGSDHE